MRRYVKQKVRRSDWWKIDWVEVFHGGSKDYCSRGTSFHSYNKTRIEADCAT